MQLTSSGVYVTNFEQIQCNINLSNLLLWLELSNFGVLEAVAGGVLKNRYS